MPVDILFEEHYTLVDLYGRLDKAEEESKIGKHRLFREVMTDLRKHIILKTGELKLGTGSFFQSPVSSLQPLAPSP